MMSRSKYYWVLWFITFICYSELGIANEKAKEPFQKINQAYFSEDTQALLKLADTEIFFEHEHQQWHHYAKALTYYRLASLALSDLDEDKADHYLDQAIELLAEDKQTITQVENSGLLSSLLGMKIAVSSFRGFSLGSKIDHALKRAKENSKDNIRIMLFEAISLYNKPSMFGGDKKAAIEILKKAQQLPKADKLPYWGRDDVDYWYARMLASNDNIAQLNMALELSQKMANKYPNNTSLRALSDKILVKVKGLSQ